MNFWQTAYKYGWASKAQLQQAVGYNLITADEYQQITGEAYAA